MQSGSPSPPLTARPEWAALKAHAANMAETNVRDLFANDPQRFQTLSLREGPLLVDVSKQRVTTETLRLLLDLAKAQTVDGYL